MGKSSTRQMEQIALSPWVVKEIWAENKDYSGQPPGLFLSPSGAAGMEKNTRVLLAATA